MALDIDDGPNPYRPPATQNEVRPAASTELRLARRFSRFAAAIVDSFFLFLISIALVFVRVLLGESLVAEMDDTTTMIHGFVALAAYGLVTGYLLATRGQTVGKILVRNRIVDYNTDELVSLPKLILMRYAPFWLVVVLPFGEFIALVDLLFVFGPERRCIHDYLAGTKVIELPK